MVLEELYQDIVAKMVEAIEDSDNKHTQLVIIPALNDVTHDYVFPQAPNPSIDHEVCAVRVCFSQTRAKFIPFRRVSAYSCVPTCVGQRTRGRKKETERERERGERDGKREGEMREMEA